MVLLDYCNKSTLETGRKDLNVSEAEEFGCEMTFWRIDF